jgi:hypothetical protein
MVKNDAGGKKKKDNGKAETSPDQTAAREAEEESHWVLAAESLLPLLRDKAKKHWWKGGL